MAEYIYFRFASIVWTIVSIDRPLFAWHHRWLQVNAIELLYIQVDDELIQVDFFHFFEFLFEIQIFYKLIILIPTKTEVF